MTSDKLKELDAKATPGPWEYHGSHFYTAGTPDEAMLLGQVLSGDGRCPHDRNLIVALRNDALRIITQQEDEIERLREALLMHNDCVRSAAAIAGRNGEATNWLSFRGQVHFTLVEYHDLTNECRAALENRNDRP